LSIDYARSRELADQANHPGEVPALVPASLIVEAAAVLTDLLWESTSAPGKRRRPRDADPIPF